MGRSAATKAARKGSRPVSQPGGTSNPANSAAAFVEGRMGADPKPGEPAYEEMKAKLAKLEKETKNAAPAIHFQVGAKGGVSVYGLGRFPVTLYYEQWVRLLDVGVKLRQFLEAAKKDGKLTMKGDKK